MTSDIDQKSATPRSARWRTIGTLRTGPGSSTLPFGWAPAIVLILVAFVDRIEFSLVAAVLPQLQAEWGFGDAVAGSLPTASAIAAGILAIPAAYIADRHDRPCPIHGGAHEQGIRCGGIAITGRILQEVAIRGDRRDNAGGGDLLPFEGRPVAGPLNVHDGRAG